MEKGGEIFKQLSFDQSFAESIRKLKNTYKIPPKGFKNEREKLRWKKHHLYEYKDIDVTRERFDLDAKDNPQLRSETVIKSRVSVFYLDLCKILKKFDLSLEWLPFIRNFVINKDKEKLSIYSTELIRESLNGLILQEYINFQIGATKVGGETLAEIWKKDITTLQSKMQGFKEKGKRPKRTKTRIEKEITYGTKLGFDDEKIFNILHENRLIDDKFELQNIRKIRQRKKNRFVPNS